jgi:hypothetical protein
MGLSSAALCLMARLSQHITFVTAGLGPLEERLCPANDEEATAA